MRLTWLVSSMVGIARGQQAQIIVQNNPAVNSDDGMVFTQDGEAHQISYLDREFAPDDGKLAAIFAAHVYRYSSLIVYKALGENFSRAHLRDVFRYIYDILIHPINSNSDLDFLIDL